MKNKRGRQTTPQAPKARNEDWMRARLDQSNRNNTIPSGKRYSRKSKYKEF